MSTVAAPPAERPTDRRAILLVVSGLMLVMLLASLDQTIVSTALPTIVGELGGLEHLPWVITAYLLAVTVVTPLYGKLGDQYGRKVVLQAALGLFLVGSALCGLAQGMSELIAFRAIQGLGGGGLMVSAQAAIGDVVPPRERGRWTGLFGAVFGVSSIAGPLIGGFLTTHVSWRWIFYVNLPLGVLAVAVLAVTLPGAGERIEHRIDYEGTALLAVALSAIVLATTLGGTSYDWDSAFIVGMGAIGVLALAGFVVAERRASEPVLPPALFRNRVFVVTSAVGLVVGFALFGALTFLPLFQQVVRGDSPTESGLQLLPVVGGLLATSIISGQVITRTGRYRAFPIAGTAVGFAGMLLLGTLDRSTSPALAALYMLVLGAGLGLVMQVLVLAVQNSVPYEQLGVATSGATLFRSIGGSVGTAVLGAVFTNRLADALGGAGGAAAGAGQLDPSALQRLPAAARDAYLGAFTDALDLVFLAAAGVMAVAFALAWLLPERPLRTSVRAAGLQQAFAAPEDTDSVREVARELSVLVGREGVIGFLARAAARADVDVSPAGGWLLARAASDGTIDVARLAAAHDLDEGRLREACRDMRRRQLLTGGPDDTHRPHPCGRRHRRRAGRRPLRSARGPRGGLVAGRAPRARPLRRVAVRGPRHGRAAAGPPRLTRAPAAAENPAADQRSRGREPAMAWKLDGSYFETCSCEVVCPCTASLANGAHYDRCRVTLVFHVADGDVEGTDVSGLTVAAIADTPRVMTEGNWRLGVFIDAAASDEQAEKLGAVFGGALGGPMEALGPLVGEQLGVERAPIELREDGLRHSVRIGDKVDFEVEDIVPFGVESGEPARLTGIFHPVGSELTISRATRSKISAFGIEYEGKSGFSASEFHWAA